MSGRGLILQHGLILHTICRLFFKQLHVVLCPSVRYHSMVGSTEFAPGQWAGIELDEEIGKNDGSRMEGYGTSHASQSMVSDACHMTYCGSMVTVDWQLFAISAEQRT